MITIRRILPAVRYACTGRIPDDAALDACLARLDAAFDRVDIQNMIVSATQLGIEIGPALDAIGPRPHLTMIPGGAR